MYFHIRNPFSNGHVSEEKVTFKITFLVNITQLTGEKNVT